MLENMHPLQKGCKRRKIFGTDEKKLNIKHTLSMLFFGHISSKQYRSYCISIFLSAKCGKHYVMHVPK
jgi:hypothetical protein